MSESLKFAADRMLGRLCKWLRICGFDSLYISIHGTKEIEYFQKESRIILTRNQKWRQVRDVLFIVHDHPMEQLKAVVQDRQIDKALIHPFRICIRCNHLLRSATKHEVYGKVPEYTYTSKESFYLCSKCDRIYWRGSHPVRMAEHMAPVFGHPINVNLQGGQT